MRLRPSRERYRSFVDDYKHRRLEDALEPTPASPSGPLLAGKRREYLHDYLRWLWPHRYQLAVVFLLALLVAGLEMIEPLFMRFIIDRVLLNDALDAVRPAAAPAAAEALGHEDRRNSLAADRRRRNDERAAAHGGHLAEH